MTDEQIAEIYALARESFFGGQRAFQIQAFPFRMTPVNMAKHRGNPNMAFWKMLKEGYDHFEVTRQEPKVDVCEKHYVFNASQPAGSAAPLNFSPRAQCPVYEVPQEIASAVAEKKQKDETAVADLIRRGTPAAPIKMATDGGMHQIFAEALQGREVRGKDGEVERVRVSAPGTIPPTVNPPANVLAASAPPAAPAQSTPASRSIVARAPTQPAAKPAQTAPAAQPTQTAAVDPIEKTRNFLSGLFTTNGAQTQTASAPAASPPAAATSAPRAAVAAAVRPGAHPAPAPAAKPKPAPTAIAEAKPTPLPEAEDAAAPRLTNAGAIRPQSPVSAFSAAPASSSGLLSGAAPVIPGGSFGTSWSGLR
jgi:hypothetical protein